MRQAPWGALAQTFFEKESETRIAQDVAMEDVVPTGVAALGALNRVVSPLCLVLGLGTWHGKLGLKVL